MARIKNASFVGVSLRDVVADAPIKTSWLRNVVGDLALLVDRVTGRNGETPINHTGGVNGCPMRIPLAAQHLDRSLVLSGNAVSKDDMFVLAVPVFVPAGHDGSLRLEVDMRSPSGFVAFLDVINSSGSSIINPTPSVESDLDEEEQSARRVSRHQRYSWVFSLGPGLYFVRVKRRCTFLNEDPDGRLVSWTLDYARTSLSGSGLAMIGDVTNAYRASSAFTSSTIHDTYDEEVQEDGPLSAYVLTRVNRQINTLWEYVTGSRIPGNSAYQCSTTWNNNRASFTSEGLLDFPLACVVVGAAVEGKSIVNDYTLSSPTDGLLGHCVHPTTRSTTNENVCSVMMQTPSFRTSPSDLRCTVLCHAPGGSATNWRFRVSSSAGASSAVAPSQIGITNFFFATITSVPFTSSSSLNMNVQIANVANGALGSERLDVLGVCFYFDP